MSRSPLRAAAGALSLSALALAGVPATSLADVTVTRLSNDSAIDVSGDGRYVLLSTGAVIDRTTGTTSAPVPGTPIDLASASPKVLYAAGGRLYVKDAFGSAPGTLVSLNASGAPVEATSGRLVKDGTEVAFVPSTTTGLHTIVVGASKSDLRIPRAITAGASEDGRVLTFTSQLPPEPRPAGLKARDAKPAVGGVLLGYSVDGGAPRRLGVSKVEERLGAPSGAITCATNYAFYKTTTPTLPHFAQDGLAGGRYQFTPSTQVSDTLYPDADRYGYTREWQDPISGAFASVVTTHGGYPNYNSPRVINEAGIGTDLPFPTNAPSEDTAGFAGAAFSFAKGAGAILVGQPRSGAAQGSFLVEGLPTDGESVIPWQQLPRAEDPLVTGQETVDVSWATCKDPAPPAATDYVTITPKPSGNSAGTITLKPTPQGRPPVRSLTATMSWYGIRTWSRTTTTPGTLDLPSIPWGIPGFKVTATLALVDGTTATTSATLLRTRW